MVLAEDRGKAFSGLALALLTVLATVVAGLQGDANSRAQQGKRVADRLAIEASGQAGQLQLAAGTQYSIWERWYEQVQRSSASTESQQANPEAPRAKVLEVLAKADQEISAWMQTQSELLRPPYYDAATLRSDFTAYAADHNVRPDTLAQTRQKIENAVAVAWDRRSADYITILTIVAVALFFVGLGSQLRRPARTLLAVAGAGLGVAALCWATALAATPVPRVPDQVAVLVADSDAAYTRARETPNDLTQSEQDSYRRAIELAGQALAIAPGDSSALERRGQAQLAYGEQLRFVNGRSAQSDGLVAGALGDFQALLDGGDLTYITLADVGWAAFLAGDVDRALTQTNRAVALQPIDAGVWVQRAVVKAYRGDPDGARQDVEAALQASVKAAQDSAAYGFGVMRYDLLQLAEERPDLAQLLRGLERRIAESTVAVAVHGTPDVPAAMPPLDVSALTTLRITPDGTLRVSEPVVAGAPSADPDAVGYRLTVRATGVPEGATLSARLSIGGILDAGYATDVKWPAGATEQTVDLLTPYGKAHYQVDPGRYLLQVYLDGATVGTLEWSVPAQRGPALRTTFADLIAYLTGLGWRCDSTTSEGNPVNTCQAHREGTTFSAEFTTKPNGSFVKMTLLAQKDDTSSVVDIARPFFRYFLEQAYGQTQGDDLMTWVEQRGAAFGQIRARGTWLQSDGDAENTRRITVLP